MELTDRNREPTPFDLKVFGLIAGAILTFVGWLVMRRSSNWIAPGTIWGIAAALVVVYYAVPNLRRMLYLAWMRAFYPVGWIVSHALLAIVYYLVLTPIGLVLRLFGADPMQRGFDRSAKTYWETHPADTEASRYFRQF
jgi:hypothetical protein